MGKGKELGLVFSPASPLPRKACSQTLFFLCSHRVYPLFLGNLNRVDTRLQLHGVGLATSIYDRCRSLIHPFSCSIDLEAVWAPHSRDLLVHR